MITALLVVAALSSSPSSSSPPSSSPSSSSSGSSPWTEIHRDDDLVVMTRPRAGLPVNEMRAVGTVDVPADSLWALVSDIEAHTRLIPDTTVSKILRYDGDTAIVLQRSEPQLLSPREYVIAVDRVDEVKAGTGRRRTMTWHALPKGGHEQTSADAVVVDVNSGSWSVEALDNGRSRVTFALAFDPAGFVPAFVVNAAQRFGAQEALAVLVRAAIADGHRAIADGHR